MKMDIGLFSFQARERKRSSEFLTRAFLLKWAIQPHIFGLQLTEVLAAAEQAVLLDPNLDGLKSQQLSKSAIDQFTKGNLVLFSHVPVHVSCSWIPWFTCSAYLAHAIE
jgi:hypothetical protein